MLHYKDILNNYYYPPEDVKKVWDKLKKGDFGWSHLACTIWPDRVGVVCRNHRSIAHGLEALSEVEKPACKKKVVSGQRKKKNS